MAPGQAKTMRSPSTLGILLIIISLSPLIAPFIPLGFYFLDVSLPFMSTQMSSTSELPPPPSSLLSSSQKGLSSMSLSPQSQPLTASHSRFSSQLLSLFESLRSPTSSLIGLRIRLSFESTISIIVYIISFLIQALIRIVSQMPQVVAYSLTFYVGICLGYVGLVHLQLVRPN